MKDKTTQKATQFLQSENRDFQYILGKVKVIEALNKKVLPLLEPHTAAYCQVANVTGNKLIMLAANGSVATQIRFLSNDLLRKFKQDPELSHIQLIECKVRPVTTQSRLLNNPTNFLQPLSTHAAEIMRTMAESIEDPKLKAVLLRIAGRN